MKKNVTKIFIFILCIIITVPSFVYAVNTDVYKGIYGTDGTSKVKDIGGPVLNIARVIGVSVGVIMLVILGIKYMLMSSNSADKASIKEKLIPYVIGAILMFGGAGLISMVAGIAQNLK